MKLSLPGKTKIDPNVLQLSPGDNVRVSYKVKEASKERLQTLSGLVVRVRRGASGGSFTIRRVSYGVGVEHTLPFAMPALQKVEVVRHGKVRRARLYYIRRLSAKEARLKERREKIVEKVAEAEGTLEDVAVTEPVAAGPASETASTEQAAAEVSQKTE